MVNPVPWWLIQVALALVALFFIIFGVNLLYVAYQITDPFSFIMTFFASNFMILISLTLFISFILKMVGMFRRAKDKQK